MFQNAIMYNNRDHDVYKMAEDMQKDAVVYIEVGEQALWVLSLTLTGNSYKIIQRPIQKMSNVVICTIAF